MLVVGLAAGFWRRLGVEACDCYRAVHGDIVDNHANTEPNQYRDTGDYADCLNNGLPSPVRKHPSYR